MDAQTNKAISRVPVRTFVKWLIFRLVSESGPNTPAEKKLGQALYQYLADRKEGRGWMLR